MPRSPAALTSAVNVGLSASDWLLVAACAAFRMAWVWAHTAYPSLTEQVPSSGPDISFFRPVLALAGVRDLDHHDGVRHRRARAGTTATANRSPIHGLTSLS